MPGPQPRPLPDSIGLQAFAVRQSPTIGVSRRRLQSLDLERPFRGVRMPRPVVELDSTAAFLRLCRALSLRLRPGEFLSHETAAHVWGCPLPRSPAADEPLHVTATGGKRAARAAGVVGHTSRYAGSVVRFGLPVSTPEEMWLSLAATLPLDELVVVGDHLILEPRVLDPHDPRPFATIDSLRRALGSFSGRGARAAAIAIELLQEGSESRPETLLRLLLWRAGFLDMDLQARVTDADGRFVGYLDILLRGLRVGVEYDGDHHRSDSRQFDLDEIRKERMRGALHGYISVRSWELFGNPASVVRRVREALAAAGG